MLADPLIAKATQSVVFAGPPVTATVRDDPGVTGTPVGGRVPFTEIWASGVGTETAPLVARRPKVLSARNRNSYAPAAVGTVKCSVAADRPEEGSTAASPE